MNAWGRRFFIKGADLEAVSAMLVRRMDEHGLAVSRYDAPDGSTSIHGVQRARASLVVLRGLVQRISWVLTQSQDKSVVIDFDCRWFAWYRGLVALLAVPAGWLWYIGICALLGVADALAQHTLSFATLVQPWLGVAMVALITQLVLGDMTATTRLFDDIKSDLRWSGARLDENVRLHRNRKVLPGAGLLLGIAVLAVLAVSRVGAPLPFPRSGTAAILISVLVLMFILLGVIVAFLIMLSRWPESNERFAPAMPGLGFLMGLICLLATQLPGMVVGAASARDWQELRLAQLALPEGGEATVAGTQAPTTAGFQARVSQFRLHVVLCAFTAMGTVAAGLAMFVESVKFADPAYSCGATISRDIDAQQARLAASGTRFLRPMRAALVTAWLLMFAVLSAEIIGLFANGLSVVEPTAPISPHEPVGVVRGTAYALSYLLGREMSSPATIRISVVVWATSSLAAVFTVGVSIGDWVFRRRKAFRLLRKDVAQASSQPEAGPLVSAVTRIARRTRLKAPMAAVTRSDRAFAASHWTWGEQFVEVSTAALALLDSKELEALVAHEWGHLLCGHVRRHTVLQFLGSATLVGGAFVGALEGSFGYELEADRAAVQLLQINPQALRRALMKLHVAALIGRSEVPGGKVDADGVGESQRVGWLKRWRRRCRHWLAMYTFDSAVSYWHPSLRERVEALERMEVSNGSPAPPHNRVGTSEGS